MPFASGNDQTQHDHHSDQRTVSHDFKAAEFMAGFTPATAIALNENTVPLIQNAARIDCLLLSAIFNQVPCVAFGFKFSMPILSSGYALVE